MFIFDDDDINQEIDDFEENEIIDENQEVNSEEEEKENIINENEQFKQQISNLEKQVANLQEANLRLRAEFDNFKKRTSKEKQGLYTSAQIDCIEQFLPVFDGFERGLKEFNVKADSDEDVGENAIAGFKMLLDSFDNTLKKMGVEVVGQKGEPFDPRFHNAVKTIEVDGADTNIIWEVLLKGYCMGDNVVRHAVVVVANP